MILTPQRRYLAERRTPETEEPSRGGATMVMKECVTRAGKIEETKEFSASRRRGLETDPRTSESRCDAENEHVAGGFHADTIRSLKIDRATNMTIEASWH